MKKVGQIADVCMTNWKKLSSSSEVCLVVLHLVNRIKVDLEQAEKQRHKLIILLCAGEKKKIVYEAMEQLSIPQINLNLNLSEQLKDIVIARRTRIVSQVVKQIIQDKNSTYVCFDNIELLFSPDLKQDPVRLFESASGNTTLIVLWPGDYKNDSLTYATVDHCEYYESDTYKGLIITL